MAINRRHWKPPFAEFPAWLCPDCQSGSLSLDDATLHFIEIGTSRAGRGHPAWEPEWIDERFSGLLVCQDKACGAIVAIGGQTHHVAAHDLEHQELFWVRLFEPRFLYPAPPAFAVPEECPKAVADELKKAFALFWLDIGSCANRLRSATEALLNDRAVPRTAVNAKRRRERISLHARIEKFRERDARSADHLLAIKWLGNAGSHANLDDLSGDDLFDGFELFEHVLERVYVRREERLRKVAEAINARKGRPVRRKAAFFNAR